MLGRGELARRGGVPRHRAYPSVGLSLAALYLAALGTASLLVPLDLAKQAESPAALALLALLPLGLAALHPRVLTLARDLLVRFTGRGADIAIGLDVVGDGRRDQGAAAVLIASSGASLPLLSATAGMTVGGVCYAKIWIFPFTSCRFGLCPSTCRHSIFRSWFATL